MNLFGAFLDAGTVEIVLLHALALFIFVDFLVAAVGQIFASRLAVGLVVEFLVGLGRGRKQEHGAKRGGKAPPASGHSLKEIVSWAGDCFHGREKAAFSNAGDDRDSTPPPQKVNMIVPFALIAFANY